MTFLPQICNSGLIYYFCKEESKPKAILNKFLFYSERAGSNVDLRVANKCFTDLGFEVHIHRNLRYIDVTNLLEQLATEIDHRQGFPTFQISFWGTLPLIILPIAEISCILRILLAEKVQESSKFSITRYRISAYSFRGNCSFFKFGNAEIF